MTAARYRLSRLGGTGSRRAIAMTAMLNVAMTASAATAGLVIARELGPALRGEYAAVSAWFGIALIVGELGQPAAICYYVASDSRHGRDYVATSRRVMLATGAATAAAGWFIAPVLGRGQEQLVEGFRIMFVTCVLSFVSGSYLFALQAMSLRMWNVCRAVQPALFLIMILSISVFGHLTLMSTIAALVVTIGVQALAGVLACRQLGLGGGSFESQRVKPLLKYGVSQLAGSAPTSVNGSLDQLILSATTSYQNLGVYAVAVSVTSLVMPIVSAIGNVLFPRIAAQAVGTTKRLEQRAVRASAVVATVTVLAIAASSPWLLPYFFGQAYGGSVRLVWILSAGAVFLSCGQVVGDLLRGRGQPLAVAFGQGVGAVITVGLLLALLPLYGIVGAAIASTLAYSATFVVLFWALRRRQDQAIAPSDLPVATLN